MEDATVYEDMFKLGNLERGDELAENISYRRADGCLMDLVIDTGTDLVHAVGTFSKVFGTLWIKHRTEFKGMLRFLNRTVSEGLSFARISMLSVVAIALQTGLLMRWIKRQQVHMFSKCVALLWIGARGTKLLWLPLVVTLSTFFYLSL